MTTPEDYKGICSEVNHVDPMNSKGNPPTVGTKFTVGSGASARQYEVVDVGDDPVTGFQGMAVAPVDDRSQVTIAYAGTNMHDPLDDAADGESVIGGMSGSSTQVADAEAFARQVVNDPQNAGASFTVTGHSLGGYLALDVAAENHWPATAFNGPDPQDVLSPQAKQWVADTIAGVI